uniref:Uncharacterized protein n=1 Tax=Oncorhynchus tshawytscha TaxID=74940 RepID=A0AAZ3QIX1_ONCTS
SVFLAMQIELRELRQWTSLISDSHRPTKWDGIRGRREWCTGQSLVTHTHTHAHTHSMLALTTILSDILLSLTHVHFMIVFVISDEDDYTLVKWDLGPSLGEGLQGLCSSTKRLHGIETSLMTCIQSMPSNIAVAQNTCYTAGVHYLEPGSTLELCIPRKSAGLVLKPHTTFLGTE